MKCKRCGIGKLYFIRDLVNYPINKKIIGSCYICNSCGRATIDFNKDTRGLEKT